LTKEVTLIPLHTYFDPEIYNLCLKSLTNGKTPRPDTIPNSILKHMPPNFHHMLYLLFKHCFKQRQIPTSWKTSLTILLYKKSDPTLLSNHRPIALANTIYKLFTNTLTTILSGYGEKYYMTARKAFMLNAALLDNSKLLLVPLKMLKSPTKTYIFFILTSKTLLDPLIMPNYSPL
jgi:hypothetical protein